MAQLRIHPRKHGYTRGKDVYEQILRAAFHVWVEQGSDALTLRRIASECGMKAGNINHYFSSKEELIGDLLEAITLTYEELMDEFRHDPALGPEEQLVAYIELVLSDLTSKETTRIFPDLWAAANHDPFFQKILDEIYARSRKYVSRLVGEINPGLTQEEQDVVALFMQASLEGLTVFAGYDKPGRDHIEWLSRVAQQSFLGLIGNAKTGEISGSFPLPVRERPSSARKGGDMAKTREAKGKATRRPHKGAAAAEAPVEDVRRRRVKKSV